MVIKTKKTKIKTIAKTNIKPKVSLVSDNKPKSNITKLVYYAIMMASIGMILLGFMHQFDVDEYGVKWGQMALIMGFLGFIGYLGNVYLHEDKLLFRPTEFRNFESKSIVFGFMICLVAYIVQVVIALTLSVSSTERIAYHLFSAVVEESFFRGFLQEGILSNVKVKSSKFYKIMVVLTSLIISSVMFALLHFNYYGDSVKLFSVFILGMIFGIAYLYTRDLTSVVAGHFFLNFLITIINAGQVVVR